MKWGLLHRHPVRILRRAGLESKLFVRVEASNRRCRVADFGGSTVSAVKPSETTRGAEWLRNFLAEDLPVAALLLDGLTFVSLSTIRRGLISKLHELADSGQVPLPALLVPALSLEDIGGRGRHVAYNTFPVGGKIDALPGSEALVGNLVRQLVRERAANVGRWLPPSTQLEELRSLRCRSVVFVTDYSGSSQQLIEFARTFIRHPTIRSWRSGGLVRLHALSFAVSPIAETQIMSAGSPIDQLWSCVPAPTFNDRPWTAAERAAVEQLCLDNTPRRNRWQALGYKASRGLFATEGGAPNNLPWLLRRPSDANWRSFFEERGVPPDLAVELGEYKPILEEDEFETLTGQQRLARALSQRAGTLRPASIEMLGALALLHRRRMGETDLAASMALDMARTRELLTALGHLGLIDETLRVTDRGVAELRGNKRGVRRVHIDLAATDDNYYPKALR